MAVVLQIRDWSKCYKDMYENILDQKNSGIAKSRNLGISKANGEFIAFLDNDDKWEKDKISKQVDVLSSDKGVSIIFTDDILTMRYDI